jgi:5'-3' exonuclease
LIDTKENADGKHYGGVFQFFLQVRMMLQAIKYDYVYVVFDDTDSGILRYELYNEYKANRDKKYAQHMMSSGQETDYWKRLNQTIKGMTKFIKEKERKNDRKKELTDEEIEKRNKRQTEKDIVDENFERERNIIMLFCVEMSIRVLFDDKTEGDDFIAYYVNHKQPEEKIVIVSADQDLTQLISPTVSLYNRMTKKYLKYSNFQRIKGFPVENVLLKKVFCGDTSDNIGNIKGLSEARLMELMPEIAERPVTIEEVIDRAKEKIEERKNEKKKPLQWHENIVNGVSNKEYNGDFYEINKKIIDLKHPLLTESAENDIESVMYAPLDPEGRSFENLYSMISKNNIEIWKDAGSFSTFFRPFKELSDREKQRYEEFISENHC